MALDFRPPEWLMQEYVNRKTPYQEASEGLQTGLANYLEIDQSKRRNALFESQIAQKNAEIELAKQKNAREQGEYAHNYEPASLPGTGGAFNQFSPNDFGAYSQTAPTLTGPAQTRAMLTQSGSPATMGPGAAQAQGPESLISRWSKWQSSNGGVGLGQNKNLAPAPENPREQANLEFAQQFPQGLQAERLAGTVTDTIAQKDTAGNIIGYTQVNRPRGGRTLTSGPSQMGTPQLAEVPGTGQMAWFTPPSPATPGQTPQPVGQPTTPGIPARGGATVTPVAKGLTKAQVAVDADFAKDYNDFTAQGGQTDPIKLVAGIDDAITQLESGKVQATGRGMGLIGRAGRTFVSPKGGVIEDQVRDAVQRNLRIILGGQFAQQEGENLVRTAYNTGLPEPEVARRLKALSTQMKLALKAKQDAVRYYEQNGTLSGYKGKIYSMADFNNAVNTSPTQQSGQSSGGLTPDEQAEMAQLERELNGR